MNEESGSPPHARGLGRLLGLIRDTGVPGWQVDAFNPWKMAFYDSILHKMEPSIDGGKNPNFIEWIRARELCQQAEKDWEGPYIQRPDAQVMAARFCLDWKRAIELGDGTAVMEAVAQCAAHGLVLPGWLAAAFVEREQRVMLGMCKGWGDDEAFGSVIPKGSNLAGVRAAAQFQPWAYEVAIDLLLENPNQPIEGYLYEQVGEKIGRKATLVQALIKSHCKNGFHAPLTVIRTGFLNGHSLEKVLLDWADTRQDAFMKDEGWEAGADGAWQKTGIKKP